MTRPLLPLPVRIILAVTVTLVIATLRLLVGAGRLGLWVLALAGFRGARLVALAGTGVGVWWAAGVVGLRPAVWLAVIGWAAWAVRHHRAAIRQHAAIRRLTAALAQHTDALATAGKARLPRPATASARTARPRMTLSRADRADSTRLDVRPWPDASQSPEHTLAALGRHAARFVARHAPPADPAPTRRRWRHPR
jgi:hypothetical protein